MTHPVDPIEPGQIAYESRFPVRGLRAEADEWSMLPDRVKQVWARVEAAPFARGPAHAVPAGHVTEDMVEAACRAAVAACYPNADSDMQVRHPNKSSATCTVWETYRYVVEPALKAALDAACHGGADA